MIGFGIILSGIFLATPAYQEVDKSNLVPGRQVVIQTTRDTIISQDSSRIVKVSEKVVRSTRGELKIGQYRIGEDEISEWTFNRFEDGRIYFTGSRLDTKGGALYFLAGFPEDDISKVAVFKPFSADDASDDGRRKKPVNEKLVLAGVCIGGGVIIGGIAGAIYEHQNRTGYPGEGLVGMSAGMVFGLLVGSFLYLRLVYDF